MRTLPNGKEPHKRAFHGLTQPHGTATHFEPLVVSLKHQILISVVNGKGPQIWRFFERLMRV